MVKRTHFLMYLLSPLKIVNLCNVCILKILKVAASPRKLISI
ncbi:hypothetical protein VP496E541_P0128 [Vibrio phage 496E54-1]|nr:hypothetical protein VP496E541_P0128 [Vibrio phage 496E54-1]